MMWFLMLFNGIITSLATIIVASMFGTNHENLWSYGGFLAGIVISFTIAKFIVSKGGNKVLGFIAPARKMSNREQERVKHILHGVQEATKQNKNFSIEDIRLYTMDSPLLNAFAMGRNVLGITIGALENLNDEELAGLIAHEFGHFFYKDSEKQAINFGLLCFAEAILWVNGLLLALRHLISSSSSKNADDSPMGMAFIIILPILMFAFMFKFMGSIGIWVYNIVYRFRSHKLEYRADLFACEIGFGAGLLSVLEKINSYEFKDNGFASRIKQTHPDTPLRIDEIDKYLAAI